MSSDGKMAEDFANQRIAALEAKCALLGASLKKQDALVRRLVDVLAQYQSASDWHVKDGDDCLDCQALVLLREAP